MENQRRSDRIPLDECTTIVEFLDPDIRQRYRLPAKDISDQAVGLRVPADHPILDDFPAIYRTKMLIRCPRNLNRKRQTREAQLYRVERMNGSHSLWVFKFHRTFPVDSSRGVHRRE